VKARRLAGAVVAALAAASGTALAQAQPQSGYVSSASGTAVTTPYGECWRGGAAPKDMAACPPSMRSASTGAPASAAAGGERQQLAQSGRDAVRERQQIAPAAGGATPASAGAGEGVMEPGYVNSPQGVNYRTAYGECWRAGHWTPALAAEPCDATARASVPAPVVAAAPKEPEPAPQAQPEPAPAPAPLAETPRGPLIQKITLETDVLFAFDKAELRPEGRQKLDEIADGLKDAEVNEIVAVGHTDRIGPENYNEKLSERRAAAVKEYLVQKGVSQERIVTEGQGEQNPVTGQDCGRLKGQKLIQCFQPDRRVEIEVYGQREVAATGEQPAAGATGSPSPGSSSGSAR
jgi:OOP family OmpA-OmpF porin